MATFVSLKLQTMELNILKGLKACMLFQGLKEEEITDLMHKVRYRVVSLKKGEIIFEAGTVCQHANIVIEGEVSAKVVGPTGKIVRMSMHHAGNLLAPAFLYAADNRYPVTVEAVSDATVMRLSPGDMELLLQVDPRLTLNFCRILANNVAFLTKKVGVLSMTVRDKLIFYFKEEEKRQRTPRIYLSLSRQELADHFGIQKFSLQRCLKELQEEGIIRVEGKYIQLL